MIQVKIFSELYTTVLEERLNEFLKAGSRKVHDIKFTRSNDNSYAMIIYEDYNKFNDDVADAIKHALAEMR